MPTVDELLAQVNALPPAERERLVRALGGEPRTTLAQLGTLSQRPTAPQSVAWVKAERGHAVLATDSGASDDQIPAGPSAIAGMWADVEGEQA